MISMNKKYTFHGEEVEILTVSRPSKDFPVVVMARDGALICVTNDGFTYTSRDSSQLIEVKPTKWINVYLDGTYSYPHNTKEEADRYAESSRIACIAFKEGDGLDDTEVKPPKWMNVSSEGRSWVYGTREEADRCAASDRIACIELKEREGI